MARALGLAVALAFVLGSAPALAAVERAQIAPGRAAILVDRKEIFLEAAPERGDGWIAFARRWTGSAATAAEISAANRKAKRPLAGVRYRVPYRLLTDSSKLAAIRALFPHDLATAEGWSHRTRGESFEAMAEWFTGGSAAAKEIRSANAKSPAVPARGATVRIPGERLLRPFRYTAPKPAPAAPPAAAAAPIASPPPPAAPQGAVPPAAAAGGQPPEGRPAAAGEPAIAPPGAAVARTRSGGIVAPVAPSSAGASLAALLDYGEDAAGKHAIYRLRPGEALYSSVVIRFTGRLSAEDVNALSLEIAKRSDIPDVTDIPIGFPVKIPFELLLPEFLPEGDSRRLEYEVELALATRHKNVVEARGLEGVTVVLDAGHGGVDVGASTAGVWESLYVYDVVLRIKRQLELRTRAKVVLTTRDGKDWTIPERDVLPYSRGHAVLTTPPYPITDSVVGVNLRWYLANSYLRRAKAGGGSADKVVFISVHADSLHPSIRGATIYVPDSAGTDGPFKKSGAAFSSRKEVREQPSVSFSAKERQRSEGLSRDFAEKMIGELREREFEIHPFKPIRDRIYRGRRAWVPAVLRYNAIPAKMLLEVCNLANGPDRELLTTRAFRERMAEAVVAGIRGYFKE